MPNPSPNRQNRIPIRSSLWPSIAPLRKLTESSLGSFSEASPPASLAGCANAAAAFSVSSATTDGSFIAMRRRETAAVASHVRIYESSVLERHSEITCFGYIGSGNACPIWPLGVKWSSSDHASTARPRSVGAWPRRVSRRVHAGQPSKRNRNKTPLPASQRKTDFYNTLDRQGQTDKGGRRHPFPNSGEES